MKNRTKFILIAVFAALWFCLSFKSVNALTVDIDIMDPAYKTKCVYNTEEIVKHYYSESDYIPGRVEWEPKQVEMLYKYYKDTKNMSKECYNYHRVSLIVNGMGKAEDAPAEGNFDDKAIIEAFKSEYIGENRAIVKDLAGVLSEHEEIVLAETLYENLKYSDYEIAVITVDTMYKQPSDEYVVQWVDMLKLGLESKDGGIILVIAKDDSSFETFSSKKHVFGVYVANGINDDIKKNDYFNASLKFASRVFETFNPTSEDVYKADDSYLNLGEFEPGYNNPSRAIIFDEAGLLTNKEKNNLKESMLRSVEIHEYDIAVVTTSSINGKSPYDVAHEYIDLYELGWHNPNGGILLLLSMQERDWYIATYGPAVKIVTNSKIDKIGDKMVSSLSNGNYYDGFNIFANEVESIFEKQNAIFLFRIIEDTPELLFIAAFFVVIITIVVRNYFVEQLKSNYGNSQANQYIVRDSIRVLDWKDDFSHKTVTKTSRSSSSGGGSSGGGRSSGGGSRGGGGGKF